MDSLSAERSNAKLNESLAALKVTETETKDSLRKKLGMKKPSKGVQKKDILSPEEQLRRNEAAVKHYRETEALRKEEKEREQAEKKQLQKQKEQAHKKQLEKARSAQEAIENMSAAKLKAVQEEIRKQELQHAKDKGFARSSAPASQTPRDHGSIGEVSMYQWEDLETLASKTEIGNTVHINDTYELVDGEILVGKVPCAPRKGEDVIFWDDLEFPDAFESSYAPWQQVSQWKRVFSNNPDGLDFLKKIGEGNFNLVFEKRDDIIVDASSWPPQLSKGGALPDDAANPAIRITRGFEFGSSRESSILEATMNLHAAKIGLGPPIYAVAIFAYNEPNAYQRMQRFGMVTMMKKCADFNSEIRRILLDPRPGYLKPHAVFCAREIQWLCFRMANLGAINFDAKPANVLVADDSKTFYMIDYDTHFFITDAMVHAHVGKKARFFINLLIFTMHIRAWTSPHFADPFCKALKKPLMEMWMDICSENRSFGEQAAKKLRTMEVKTAAQMNDDYKKENITSVPHENAERLWAQFREIIYHYFLRQESRNNHRSEVKNFNWQLTQRFTSMPLLVPQLLKFTLFYRGSERLEDENEEARWMESLENCQKD